MIRCYSLILIIFVFSVASNLLFGDAYLAEGNIHYGADSYRINYEKEIITGVGHAYFRKENKILFARKIVIFYSRNQSRAECFGNVILKDLDNNTVITGNYGYVKYLEKIYFLSGKVKYKGEDSEIFTDELYYYSGQDRYLFRGNVRYLNDEYNIASDKLEVVDDKATFYGSTRLLNYKNSETIYSNYMEYNLDNNDSFFKGGVIYQSNQKDNNFLVTAEAIRYINKLSRYYLINNVFIISKEYRIKADFMVYDSNNNYLKAVGNVNAQGDSFNIRGDIYIVNNLNNEIDFINNVNGIYTVKTQ